MLKLQMIPAFADNYIWLLHDGTDAWVVDPGDAAPVFNYLRHHHLTLKGILLTHHHHDHVGGVDALCQVTDATVYGPVGEPLPTPTRRLRQGDQVEVIGQKFEVIEVPGHTAGHIAYFSADSPGAPLLFCGDTLFSGGCGRLFEGTPAQMLASLDKLAVLPPETRVCPAHEYTVANLRFARAVEPSNQTLASHAHFCEELRAKDLPTVPSQLGLELQINPFLRSREPSVRRSLLDRIPRDADDAQSFAALRQWKNSFR